MVIHPRAGEADANSPLLNPLLPHFAPVLSPCSLLLETTLYCSVCISLDPLRHIKNRWHALNFNLLSHRRIKDKTCSECLQSFRTCVL